MYTITVKISYRAATRAELKTRWEYLIVENPGDSRWVVWKDKMLAENESGKCKTFLAFDGEQIIGEVTLVLEKHILNGLRVNKEYEVNEIASGLVKFVEAWALQQGMLYMIIGVEPRETRNMQIYFNWGYIEFISSAEDTHSPKNETDQGETILVLYYRKWLK